MKVKDILGKRYGKLTVIKFVETKNRQSYWLCKCDCGNEKILTKNALARTRSCGCLKHKINDLTGKKFNHLTVVRYYGRNKGKTLWECKCDCGNIKIVSSSCLLGNYTKSCGCEAKLKAKIPKVVKHGKSRTRLYKIYIKMIRRCHCEKDKDYRNYGGRGIGVCQEWKENFMSFYNWAMSNGYTETLTLDRIDNDGNYEPNNCRWTTMKEQSNNTRTNRYITYNGQTKTLTQWAEQIGLKEDTLRARIVSGRFTIERAFTQPLEVHNVEKSK